MVFVFTECQTGDGSDYDGTVSTTEEGLTCQRWDQQTPHGHSRNKANMFPDDTVSEAENYCRNPDGSARVWCYTTEKNTRWQYCDVPECPGKIQPQLKRNIIHVLKKGEVKSSL